VLAFRHHLRSPRARSAGAALLAAFAVVVLGCIDRNDPARVLIEAWRREYNTVRPHSSLGNLTPAEFAERCSTTQQTEAVL